MPPSNMMNLLMRLQMDLNKLTIDCVEANSSLTDILGFYDGGVHNRYEIKPAVVRWTNALSAMSDSLEKFQADANKLGEYLDAQE